MEDISLVADHYKTLQTAELIEIARDPAGLRPEIIPVLQKELITRNQPDEALLLSDFLLNGPSKLKRLSTEALQQLINQRLGAGEPLESIKIDLQDNGINIFDVINNESKEKNKTFEYMIAMKEQGLNGKELNDKLQETFAIQEEESEILKMQLKKKGQRNMIIGWSIVVIVSIFMLISAGMDRYPGIGAILLFGIGIWRIIEGKRQSK